MKLSDHDPETPSVESKRKPGKQPGAPGYGRQQALPVDRDVHHHPQHCACCNAALTPAAAKAYTGYETSVTAAPKSSTTSWAPTSKAG